jgi:malic enzyme
MKKDNKMKNIKLYLTGTGAAGIYVSAAFVKQLSSSQCTGTCVVCGGTCFLSILVLQVIGLFILSKEKVIRYIKMIIDKAECRE